MSQNGNLPQIGMKIKNIWNHHPDSLGTCNCVVQCPFELARMSRISPLMGPIMSIRWEVSSKDPPKALPVSHTNLWVKLQLWSPQKACYPFTTIQIIYRRRLNMCFSNSMLHWQHPSVASQPSFRVWIKRRRRAGTPHTTTATSLGECHAGAGRSISCAGRRSAQGGRTWGLRGWWGFGGMSCCRRSWWSSAETKNDKNIQKTRCKMRWITERW